MTNFFKNIQLIRSGVFLNPWCLPYATAYILGGCTTTVQLPVSIKGKNDKVYLIQYETWGHHSLAFYREGKLIEFTYGDWELFALNKRDGWTAWVNLTFPTQGALGKKVVPWIQGKPICPLFHQCQKVVSIFVPKQNANVVFKDLMNKYNKNLSSEVFNKTEKTHFVYYKKSYWGFHNCNHELVEWLENLDIKVSGRVFYKPNFIDSIKVP